MADIKRLSLILTILHALATAFAAVVLALAAAAIAQTNQAAAAVSNLTGALSSMQSSFGSLGSLSSFGNKRLLLGSTLPEGAGAFIMIGFGAFLGFTLFVAISGFLLSGFFAVATLWKPAAYDKTLGALSAKSPAWAKRPFYDLLIACVWSIFWLAAAGSASDSPLARISGYCAGVSSCDQINALVALSWLSWLIWLAVVVLLAVDMGLERRKASKVAAGEAAAAAGAAAAKDGGKDGAKAGAAKEAADKPQVKAAEAPAPPAEAVVITTAPGVVEATAVEADKPKEGDVEAPSA